MSFLDKLVGGEKEYTTHRESLLTPEQEAILKKWMGQITEGMGGVEAYPGTTVPSEDFLQDYYAGAEGFDQDPLRQQSRDVLESGLSMEPLWDTDMDAAKDYWQTSFADPAMMDFKKDILPQLREDYAGTGTYDSGGRRRAETGAAATMSTDLNAQLAEIMWREQESGRLAKEAAMTRALQAQTDVAPYLAQGLGYKKDVGTMKTGFEASRLGEDKEKWLTERPENSPYLSMVPSALGVKAFEPWIEQSQPWYGVLGQAGIEAAAGANFMGLGGGGTTAGQQPIKTLPRGDGGGSDWGGISTMYTPGQLPYQTQTPSGGTTVNVGDGLGLGGYKKYGQMTYPDYWRGSAGALY